MNVSDIMCVRMPAGPAKRASQMGGSILFFSKSTTKEQFDACIDWYQSIGAYATEITEAQIQATEENLQDAYGQKQILLHKTALPLLLNVKNQDKVDELNIKYANVEPADFDD